MAGNLAPIWGLDHIGFKDEVKMIQEHWKMYVDLSGGTMEANFKLAFPKHILEHCSILALEATKAIKCQIAHRDLKVKFIVLLIPAGRNS